MKDMFFDRLELLAKKKFKGDFQITLTYVNGEKETFKLDEDLTAKTLLGLNKGSNFFYIENTIINLKNVIKIQIENKKAS
jgi:hypothetical protein